MNGLNDVLVALKWIKNHAHDFGGDSKNTMLFGQSSGGCTIFLFIYFPSFTLFLLRLNFLFSHSI